MNLYTQRGPWTFGIPAHEVPVVVVLRRGGSMIARGLPATRV